MSSTISQAQSQAKSKIENSWKSVAQHYTAVDVEAVERAAEMATIIKEVSQRFLTDWATRYFAPRYLGG